MCHLRVFLLGRAGCHPGNNSLVKVRARNIETRLWEGYRCYPQRNLLPSFKAFACFRHLKGLYFIDSDDSG